MKETKMNDDEGSRVLHGIGRVPGRRCPIRLKTDGVSSERCVTRPVAADEFGRWPAAADSPRPVNFPPRRCYSSKRF